MAVPFANGILHANAEDLGTGKEQSIQITASSGLTEQEIKQMVQDAEAHADEDKYKKEQIEARNDLDTLIYSTEKSLKEYGANLDASTKMQIEEAIAKAKKGLEGEDAVELKRTADELTQASHKLAEVMYAKQAHGAAGGAAGQDTSKENVTDADFEEVH